MVIAIIGILAGLLMPALAKARESAKGATCINNYKQISTAFASYQADYNGFMPKNLDQTYPRDPKVSGTLDIANHAFGNLDYYYIRSYIIESVNKARTSAKINVEKGGEIWECPVTYPIMEAKKIKITGQKPLGVIILNANKEGVGEYGKHDGLHSFFGWANAKDGYPGNWVYMKMESGRGGWCWDNGKRYWRKLKIVAALANIPLFYEMCKHAASPQGGYGGLGELANLSLPHPSGMTVAWADGHVTTERPPQDKVINVYPYGDNDKFAPKTTKETTN